MQYLQYTESIVSSMVNMFHFVGATGLAQCAELTWQLRNTAGKRQVPNAKLALQHNIGLGNVITTKA